MLKQERHNIILNEVALHNRVLLVDLVEKLNVSIDTVRRDVKQLDSEKKLKKVHGGALSLGYSSHTTKKKNIYALEDKVKIALKATKILKNDHVILIHGGTTCLELARLLPENLNLTCFTLSLPVALELSKKPNVKIVFIGGEIFKDGKITIGGKAISTLSEITFDYSFIGTGYVDIEHGLTEFDWDSVLVKKRIIQSSKKVILMCISEKLYSQHRYKTCDIKEVATLITELEPNNKFLEPFKKQKINLL